MAAIDPACRIRWTLLAGIGRTETNHGTYGGATVDANGNESKPIYGIPLDGTNGTAVVGDTDGGALDGEPTFDRAVGSMQFIPGTWKKYALDGNGDGVADPQNMNDAALTAANYLCHNGTALDTPAGLQGAVYHYNPSAAYVSIVASRAAHYDRYTFPPVPKT
jgi:membrane-bound lytic murein transglycosylase B